MHNPQPPKPIPPAPIPITPLEFVSLLYAGSLPNPGYLEFRMIPSRRQYFMEFPTFAGHPAEFKLEGIAKSENVYFGIALRKIQEGGRDACMPTHLLWSDIDLKNSRWLETNSPEKLTAQEVRAAAVMRYHALMEECRNFGLRPRAVVYTGHGLQAYFARSVRSSLEDTERFNKALARMLEGDPKTFDAPRIFRLPGSFNRKNPERPLEVELWYSDDRASTEINKNQEGIFTPFLETPKKALPAATPVSSEPSNSSEKESVIAAWNARNPIQSVLERYGYTRDGDRYTRPGEGASGRDTTLLLNSRGVMCSYHHSSSDPMSSPGQDGNTHLQEPFDLFVMYEHPADMKGAVKAAARELGMDKGRSSGGKVSGSGTAKEKDGDNGDNEDGDKKKPASTRLLEHTEAAGVELWHDTDSNPYMSVPVHGEDGSTGRHTFRLPSSRARSWLEGLFYREENKAIAAMAVQEALGVLKAKAVFEGDSYPAGVRILALKDVVYLDLGTPGLEVVEINKGGWLVRSSLEVPVRFWRPAGLKALPIPTKGGNLLELRTFLNTGERGFVLVVAWLVAALSGRKPYPILAFSGEQGTGKSTASRVCRDLLDPNTAGLRSAPKNERDLFISAKNGHVLSFENLSVIGPELSDSMCRMATGGGFATRTLYADDEESLFDAARPILINGIPELATRPDLADRTLSATLERIEDTNRKDEATFWAEFEAARAGILGALCTAVSTYLRNWDSTQLKVKPRMADFARLIVSAESALPWPSGAFLAHYSAARADLAASTLEGDDVATGVVKVLGESKEWKGTADELLKAMKHELGFEERAPKGFPANARVLSERLTRIAPALRQAGVIVESKKTNGIKLVFLRPLRPFGGVQEGKNPSETTSETGSQAGSQGSQGSQAGSHPFDLATLSKTPSGTTPDEAAGSQGSQELASSTCASSSAPIDDVVTL